MEDICRVCLSGYRRMYPVNKTVLQEIWERLTKVEASSFIAILISFCHHFENLIHI